MRQIIRATCKTTEKSTISKTKFPNLGDGEFVAVQLREGLVSLLVCEHLKKKSVVDRHLPPRNRLLYHTETQRMEKRTEINSIGSLLIIHHNLANLQANPTQTYKLLADHY